MHAYLWPRYFYRFWASRRVKNTLKMTILPLSGQTGSSVRRTHFWSGKWKPNLEILLVLESRQAELSNKSTWSQFGHREGLQNWLQTSATHREIGCDTLGILLSFDSVTLFFA